jgi:hypothetical protein
MYWIKKNKGFLAFGLWVLATLVEVLAYKIYSKSLDPLSSLAFLIAATIWTIQDFEKEKDSTSWKKKGLIISTLFILLLTAYVYLI